MENKIDRQFYYTWLNKLSSSVFDKEIDGVISLFEKTTFYQDSPFMSPYENLEEIKAEWENVKDVDIQNIDMKILVIDGNIIIVEWMVMQNNINYDGIYEIKFNENKECVYFKSWEMSV